jgi:hypothetical protein
VLASNQLFSSLNIIMLRLIIHASITTTCIT